MHTVQPCPTASRTRRTRSPGYDSGPSLTALPRILEPTSLAQPRLCYATGAPWTGHVSDRRLQILLTGSTVGIKAETGPERLEGLS